jgi:hypothetical protein
VDLFIFTGSSVLANITFAVKITTKSPVDRKGAFIETDKWRMGLNRGSQLNLEGRSLCMGNLSC